MSDTEGRRSTGEGLLAGRTAIVTGAASGIGRAVARRFAREGAWVVLFDRDDAAGQSEAEAIGREGGRGLFERVDVGRGAECERGVARALERTGRLDVVVNAAGIIRRATVPETTEEEWDRLMTTNVKSIYLMSRAAIPALARGGGAMINIASGWGLAAGPRAAAYCASKGAVVLLTKALAIDHAAQGIRVNCVCPGDTDTPMLRGEAGEIGVPVERFLAEAAARPLGRVGKPEEIAAAILYLAGDESSFVTGAAVVVDGGGLAGTL